MAAPQPKSEVSQTKAVSVSESGIAWLQTASLRFVKPSLASLNKLKRASSFEKFVQWRSRDRKIRYSQHVEINCTQESFQTFHCNWFGTVFAGLKFLRRWLVSSALMKLPQNLTSEWPMTLFLELDLKPASWNFWNNCRRCDSCMFFRRCWENKKIIYVPQLVKVRSQPISQTLHVLRTVS